MIEPLFTQLPDGKWLLWPHATGDENQLKFESCVDDPLIGPHDALSAYKDNQHKYEGMTVLYGPQSLHNDGQKIIYRLRWHELVLTLDGQCWRHSHRRKMDISHPISGTLEIKLLKVRRHRAHQVSQPHTSQFDRDVDQVNNELHRARKLFGADKTGKV